MFETSIFADPAAPPPPALQQVAQRSDPDKAPPAQRLPALIQEQQVPPQVPAQPPVQATTEQPKDTWQATPTVSGRKSAYDLNGMMKAGMMLQMVGIPELSELGKNAMTLGQHYQDNGYVPTADGGVDLIKGADTNKMLMSMAEKGMHYDNQGQVVYPNGKPVPPEDFSKVALETKLKKMEIEGQRTTTLLAGQQAQQGESQEIPGPNGGKFLISKRDFALSGNNPVGAGGGGGGGSGSAGGTGSGAGSANGSPRITGSGAGSATAGSATSPTSPGTGVQPMPGKPGQYSVNGTRAFWVPPAEDANLQTTIDNNFNAAQAADQNLERLWTDKGKITSGTTFAKNIPMISTLISNLRMFGFRPSQELEDAIASGQDFTKISTKLQYEISKSELGGRPAGFLVQGAINQIPNLGSSPEGLDQVLRDFFAFNVYSKDMKAAMTQYRKEHGGYLTDPSTGETFNSYAAQKLDPKAYASFTNPLAPPANVKDMQAGYVYKTVTNDGHEVRFRKNPITGQMEDVH